MKNKTDKVLMILVIISVSLVMYVMYDVLTMPEVYVNYSTGECVENCDLMEHGQSYNWVWVGGHRNE